MITLDDLGGLQTLYVIFERLIYKWILPDEPHAKDSHEEVLEIYRKVISEKNKKEAFSLFKEFINIFESIVEDKSCKLLRLFPEKHLRVAIYYHSSGIKRAVKYLLKNGVVNPHQAEFLYYYAINNSKASENELINFAIENFRNKYSYFKAF